MPIGAIRRYQECEGPNAVANELNAGTSMTDLGKELHITRQAISDWVAHHVPLAQRKRACLYCCGLLAPEVAYSSYYHPACQLVANRARTAMKYAIEERGQQRNGANHFEALALAEYERRGYAVNWLPYLASFDFLVNGLKVDVKGSRFNTVRRIYAWCMRPWQYRDQDSYRDLPSRCDLFHCIGESGSGHIHLILTAEEVQARQFLHLRPAEYCTGKPPVNDKYVDRWELFDGQADPAAVMEVG